MPKNLKKGKNGKSKAMGDTKRHLRTKLFGEEYARVLKALGDCRFKVMCFDGAERIAHCRGKLRRRVRIEKDNIILVGKREFQDSKVDIMHKYTPEEARELVRKGEIIGAMVVHGETIVEESEESEEDPVFEDTKEKFDPLAGIDDSDEDTDDMGWN